MLLLLVLMQQQADPAALATRLAAMTAVSGYERAATDSILRLVPGATRDRGGNVVATFGSGEPRRLVACPLDETGYVVGGIRPDGYLTLHRVPGRAGPLTDQQLEGQRVTVWTRRGGVPGVVAVRSVHLTRGRTAAEDPFTADNAYVDIGAASDSQAARLGVALLDPVALAKRPHRFGNGLLAAPVAGRRGSCAALLAALPVTPPAGTLVVAFVTQQNIGALGLLTVAHAGGPFTETLFLDGAPGPAGPLAERDDSTASRGFPSELGRVHRLGVSTRYAGWPVETIALPDVAALRDRISAWIGGRP